MSFEAVLTVVTVILAVLAIIPEERGQDLRIRLGGTATAVAGLVAVLVVYWSLLEPLHTLPGFRRLPRFISWLPGWDPASTSLAAFLGVTGLSSWLYGRRIPAGQLPRLSTAVTNALARRRFAECTHLLESHLEALINGLAGNYWRSRLRKRFFPTVGELHLMALTEAKKVPERVTSETDTPEAPPLAELPLDIQLPEIKEPPRAVRAFTEWADGPADAAHDIIRSISLSPALVRHIAESNPYLGLALSQLPSSWSAREFAETFAEHLVSDPDSVLYRELRRAENIGPHNVPLVDRVEQPLLASLCDDCLSEKGPELLYVFLEAGIAPVRGLATHACRRELNGPLGDYFERGRWYSPPFCAIYLLEITAPRNAVSSEARWINLFIVDSMVDALLENLSPTDGVDLAREWPTPTHYLLYACVSFLVDIVSIWRDRPADLPPNRLAERDNGLPRVLPAHAVDVLGSVMRAVLQTDKLDARFKGYLLEVWWRAYWQKYNPPWEQSDAVLKSLVQGGRFGSSTLSHRDGLEAALDHIDVLRKVSEGGDKIRSAFGLLLD